MTTKRPYISFAEVKAKITIPEVLEALGIAQEFTRKGEHLTGPCPLPQHKHGPRPNHEQFKIDCKQGLWLYKCFGDCEGKPGGAGDVIEFVKAMTGLSDAHVRFWFADKFGSRLSSAKPKAASDRQETKAAREDQTNVHSQAAEVSKINLPEASARLKPLKFYLSLDPAVPYLRHRGLSDETIQRFGLGLCNRGLLKAYVAMPIYNWPLPDGELPVAYFGRWPGEDFDEDKGRPRYKWPPDFSKDQAVFGLPQAIMNSPPGSPLIVVKSPFSVFHLSQSGFCGAVAICGSSLSDRQAALLTSTGRPLMLMFDGSEGDRHGMRQAAARLIKEAFVRVVPLADDTKPHRLAPQQLAELLA